MHPKTIFIIIISCLICLLGVGVVQAADDGSDEAVFSLQNSIESLDMEFLDGYKKQLDSEMASYLEGNTVQEWISNFIKGEWDFDLKNLGGDLLRLLFREVVANTGLLAKLLILAVISALLINLQSAFSSDVARISYLACFLALCAIAISSFKLVLGVGQQTIENMLTFMIGMLPQMLVLTAGLGNINASVMLFPLLMTASTAFANAINIIVFPLIIMSAILSIVNHMSETIKVDKMAIIIMTRIFLTISVKTLISTTLSSLQHSPAIIHTGYNGNHNKKHQGYCYYCRQHKEKMGTHTFQYGCGTGISQGFGDS
jgi:stage III sporulation protein AE